MLPPKKREAEEYLSIDRCREATGAKGWSEGWRGPEPLEASQGQEMNPLPEPAGDRPAQDF